MVFGWVIAVVEANRPVPAPATPSAPISAPMASGVLDADAPTLAFLNEASLRLVDPLRGYSGKINTAIVPPGSHLDVAPPAEEGLRARFTSSKGEVVESPGFDAPERPGLWEFGLELNRLQRGIDDFQVITLVPFSKKKEGRIGPYYLGQWPFESGGKPKTPAYEDPEGFIEVTPQNQNLWVSEHFQLKDFLTHGQGDVWPKYLLLSPRLLDKLELTIDELQREGIEVKHVKIMSGFRTPRYNHSGGDPTGRANLSRHMYGDASDIFVDNDRNNWTDDVNGDGKITTEDSKVVARAAEAVERRYPALVGGIGIYPGCCGHGPMTHIDVRGYKARWTYHP